MTKKQLNTLKRQASKHLVLGIFIFTIATIPVALHIGTNHTGSLFCWILGGIVIYDSVKTLIKLNARG